MMVQLRHLEGLLLTALGVRVYVTFSLRFN